MGAAIAYGSILFYKDMLAMGAWVDKRVSYSFEYFIGW
jgi:hypothetical protein